MSKSLPTTCPTCGGSRPVRPPDPCSDEFHHGPRVVAEAQFQEERELRRTAMDRVEALEVALGVVIEEIEGGDLQYAVSFAKDALGEKP